MSGYGTLAASIAALAALSVGRNHRIGPRRRSIFTPSHCYQHARDTSRIRASASASAEEFPLVRKARLPGDGQRFLPINSRPGFGSGAFSAASRRSVMAKEYRINAAIVLPANEIEAAHVLVKLHPVVEQLSKSLGEISKSVTVEHGSHKPRQKKEKA